MAQWPGQEDASERRNAKDMHTIGKPRSVLFYLDIVVTVFNIDGCLYVFILPAALPPLHSGKRYRRFTLVLLVGS
jgi:hypothetical protein